MNANTTSHTTADFPRYDLVVIGGSLPALVGALLVKRRNPAARVLIIENSNVLGGNLRGVDVLDDHFENGTHILQEIGDLEVDTLIAQAVSPAHLVQLHSNIGDVAATIREHKSWTLTAYPDVLGHDSNLAELIMGEITLNYESSFLDPMYSSNTRLKDVRSVAANRFGDTATKEVILPIVKRLFGVDEMISGFALELCNLTRLRLVDEEHWTQSVFNRGLHDRVAYPNQFSLPTDLRHNRKSLYSSNRGADDFIIGLERMCIAAEIEIQKSTTSTKIDIANKKLYVISHGIQRTLEFNIALSCVGTTLTRRFIQAQVLTKPVRLKYRLVHFVLREPLIDSACYYYSHDSDSAMFRLTNYSAFSGRDDDRRITVEVIGCDDLTDQMLITKLALEMSDLGLINSNSIEKSICISNEGGYPIPTVDIFKQFANEYSELKQYEYQGVYTCGLGTKDGLFFQNEILRDVIQTCKSIF